MALSTLFRLDWQNLKDGCTTAARLEMGAQGELLGACTKAHTILSFPCLTRESLDQDCRVKPDNDTRRIECTQAQKRRSGAAAQRTLERSSSILLKAELNIYIISICVLGAGRGRATRAFFAECA